MNFVCQTISIFYSTWEYRKKSFLNWQSFPFQLDDLIAKICNCKKFDSYNCFLRAKPRQGKKVLPNGMDWLCCILQVCSSKSHCSISISWIFFQFTHQLHIKKRFQIFKIHFKLLFHSITIPSSASGNTQNVASSLSTTAGNFFRKYTSPNSSASTTIEMGHIGNKSSVKKISFTLNVFLEGHFQNSQL